MRRFPIVHRFAFLALAALTPSGSAASDPGGRFAIEAPLAIESLLLDGAAVNGRLVVVGERGHILVSADGGGSWKQARVPTRALLTAVHMHDENLGWAVGHDAVILRTRDAGATWKVVHRAPEEERPLLDVWFRDAESGFAIGAYGYFLETRDGGESWKSRAISEDDYHLNVLAPAAGHDPEGQRLYIAGEFGAIYRSDDGGGNWSKIPAPYAGSWFGALAFGRNQLVLAGLRGRLVRSDDGGASWKQLDTGTEATLTGIIPLQPGAMLVTGLEGILLAGRKEGRSLSLSRLPSRKGITGAVRLPGGGLLLIGEFGVKRRSIGAIN